MLDVMFELVKTKKKALREKIESLEIFPRDYGNIWNDATFKEKSASVAGVDGSMNYKIFQDFALYGVSSTAVVNDGNGLINCNFGDINLMPPNPFLRDRIRLRMSIFELKTGINALVDRKAEYLLLDGSLIGNIVRPPAFESRLSYGIKNELIDRYSFLIKNCNFKEVEVYTDRLEDEISSNYRKKRFEVFTYIEYLEHLSTLAYLLENHGNKIIAISKESTSHNIFEDRLPDIAIFNLVSKKEGRSDAYKVAIDVETKTSFPILEKFFRDISFNLIYARFQDNKPILRIETMNPETEEILALIKNECVEGYPFILKKAHLDVLIKNQDIENIYNSLSVFRKERREML